MNSPSTHGINFLGELNEISDKYNIEKSDFCIIGSSVLALYGIRGNNDIDIYLNSEVRERICAEYGFSASEKGYISLSKNIEIKVNGYSEVGFEKDLLDDENCTIFDGYKFLNVEIEFARKVIRFAEVDEKDLPAMEKLLQEKIDWNWDLVRDVIFSSSSRYISKSGKILTHISRLKRSFSTSISSVGLFKTSLLTQKYLANSFRNFSRSIPILGMIHKRPYSKVFQADVDNKKIGIGSALSLQRKRHKFRRYDIFVRTMLFNEISHENVSLYSFRDYEIMQKKRVGTNSNQSCLELFDSIKEKGFQNKFPILLNKKGMLLDGSHRLSCSISMGLQQIPFEINRSDPGGGGKSPTYPRDWFKEGVFDETQLVRVDKFAYECLVESGAIFPIILWPPAEKFSTLVCEELQKLGWIAHKSKLDLGENLSDFVKCIYSCDEAISPWKVDLKIGLLREYGQAVNIIFFDPNNPRFRIKDSSNKTICTSMESIKRHIRSLMKNNMDKYFYDICFHSSDNFDQNAHSIQVIKKFGWTIGDIDHIEIEEFTDRFF